jgi:hypothetical protein
MILCKKVLSLVLFFALMLSVISCDSAQEEKKAHPSHPPDNSAEVTKDLEPSLIVPAPVVVAPVLDPVAPIVAMPPAAPIFPVWGGGGFGGFNRDRVNHHHENEDECRHDEDCHSDNPCLARNCVDATCVDEPILGCATCFLASDCEDNDPCSLDACINNICSNTLIPGCSFCTVTNDCIAAPCATVTCTDNQCVYSEVPDCSSCNSDTACPEAACNTVVCGPLNECIYTPINGCETCSEDSGCISPEICLGGLCAPCPNVVCNDVCCEAGAICFDTLCAFRGLANTYVSTSGTDIGNNCQEELAPCLTISYALSQTAVGNTLFVFPGTYTENNLSVSNQNITGIDGASATIVQAAAVADAVNAAVFQTSGVVILTGLTIQNGGITAGVRDGGGINAAGVTTLNSCNILNNIATNGGGIYSNGVLFINNSIISGNRATAQAGGIYSLNSLFIENSTISNNVAPRAAGFWALSGIFTLVLSTVSGNVSSGDSGGFESDALGVIANSTISNNSGTNGGGGVNNGVLTVIKSTISNNISTGIIFGGGALLNGLDGVLNLKYSTISNNSAVGGGGGITILGGSVTFLSSLVAGNQNLGSVINPTADCNGTPSSSGYNLSGSGTGCNLNSTGDINVAPATVFTTVIGSLADNGGPTQTHALLLGSPAIDQIPPATNSCGITPFNEDQRTEMRPFNINCDIGSYEAQ